MAKVYKPVNPFVNNLGYNFVKPPEYYPTWGEFASQNFQQISAGRDTTGEIYKVPLNKIFLLSRVFLSAAAVGNSGLQMVPSISTYDLISFAMAGRTIDTNFTMFLKFPPGTAFNLTGTAGVAIIEGFEVPFVP